MKKQYPIHRSEDRAVIDSVSSYTFGCTYQPRTDFSLWYEEGVGYHVHMTCHESDPRATYHENMDPVYEDSCMEFFACFYPEKGRAYINFEMNANGALLTQYHYMGDREHVKECIQHFDGDVKALVEEDRWHVRLFVPLSFIHRVYGTDEPLGDRILGNLYKCGDETASMHFGSWSPIHLPEPDFHVPQFFGELLLEGEAS